MFRPLLLSLVPATVPLVAGAATPTQDKPDEEALTEGRRWRRKSLEPVAQQRMQAWSGGPYREALPAGH